MKFITHRVPKQNPVEEKDVGQGSTEVVYDLAIYNRYPVLRI